MKRWIVEEDTVVTETRFYAVEAETLDDAISSLGGAVEPFKVRDYPDSECKYDDSHEATPEEWAEAYGPQKE